MSDGDIDERLSEILPELQGYMIEVKRTRKAHTQIKALFKELCLEVIGANSLAPGDEKIAMDKDHSTDYFRALGQDQLREAQRERLRSLLDEKN